LQAVAFAEAVAVSDLPPGSLNVLTGDADALALQLAKHMDVDAMSLLGGDDSLVSRVREAGAENVKRIHARPSGDSRRFTGAGALTPWAVAAFMEIKTVWHPAGM
jgi:acyl-CoA reductase-like NAD-dependent aldehyde dehydrogenase